MSIGNSVIDKMVDKVMQSTIFNSSGCYDPQPFFDGMKETFKQNRIDSGIQMSDDLGHIEKRVIRAIKGPIETGYEQLDEIVKKLDNDEIKIGPISEYGSNFSIHFIANKPSKEVGYRELATANENNPSTALANIRKNRIEKSKRLSNTEIKFLIGFCDKLHNKLLPKAAKQGSSEYDYVVPTWFNIIFNFYGNKRKICYTFLTDQMKLKGYHLVNDFDSSIRIRW